MIQKINSCFWLLIKVSWLTHWFCFVVYPSEVLKDVPAGGVSNACKTLSYIGFVYILYTATSSFKCCLQTCPVMRILASLKFSLFDTAIAVSLLPLWCKPLVLGH